MQTAKKSQKIFIFIVLQLGFLFPAIVAAQDTLGFRLRMQRFDDNVMLDIAAHRTPKQTKVMLFFTHSLDYGNVAVPLVLLGGGIIRNDSQMRQNALYVASSTAVTAGVTLLLKTIFKRRRPFIQNLKIVAVYDPTSTSFPSGHSSTSFATATALSSAYPKWYVVAPAMLWAGSVAYSRAYLGVHYMSDVTFGASLGGASAILLRSIKKDRL
ncbi:phosphatase PAP2 family protein [Mucilaginibacter glaciei]|uniref:Phosphatase PAP2 family protein n=1 Tax=Mucilaginibacter glaciei TaxID=2772109 RepID=A0A926S119_9SPHI|nr:phosphatase PAP2 family protein [Mucilaginibacter glaciei]MBD1391704.1 phosphatase PAP2 family protein [Mucilaginibacter glaciei]